MCSVHPGEHTCSRVAIPVDSAKDMISKTEHNMPEQKFRDINNEVSLRIYIVKCVLPKRLVRHFYVDYKRAL